MAHKKAGGSTTLGRDSESKRLGVKLQDGQIARAGSILVRQRGTKIKAGTNVRRGKDDTLYAISSGLVKFSTRKLASFTGHLKSTKIVSVQAEKK